jgi:type I restriction enzyme S subunit
VIIPIEYAKRDLPQSWRWSTLGDVTTRPTKVDPRRFPQDPFRYVDISAIDNKKRAITGARKLFGSAAPTRARQLLCAGDTLYSTVRVYLYNVALVPTDLDGALASTGFAVLRPSSAMDSGFIFNWVQTASFTNAAASLQRGMSYPSVNEPDLLSIGIPVPPLDQQRRIVAAIEDQTSRLDGAKHALITARLRSKVLKQAILSKSLVNGQFPPVAIGEIGQVFVGSTPSRSRAEYWGGSIPWVSSSEVAFHRITATRESLTELGLRNGPRVVHPKGTVMLAMIGEGKTRGQAAILDIEASHNQNCAAIRIRDGVMTPEYLYFVLLEQYRRTRILGSGNNQQALNKARVEAMEIPLPPVNMQIQIVSRVQTQLAGIDRLHEQLDLAEERARLLHASILDAAFAGTLVSGTATPVARAVLEGSVR